MRTRLMLALVPLSCANADTAHVVVDVVIIDEVFVTPQDRSTNMDSPAVWFGPAGEAWLIATGKSTHMLHIFDAGTGAPLGTVGGRGTGPGEFRRPNGIAVAGDLVFVVERDNARVQVMRLPGFEHVGFFGEASLRKPYGLAVQQDGDSRVDVFVTDDYRTALGGLPRDAELGQRVKRFTVEFGASAVVAQHVAFGETSGPGRLRTVESIAIDTAAGIVLVADEAERDVKVYHTNGAFAGRVLWGHLIRHEPEGIALYDCGGREGYWIVADQHRRNNRFLVFERRTFELIGAFTGRVVRNTDGIAIVQRAVGTAHAGILYAVHDDRAVGAFAWSDIAAALELRDDCVVEGATITADPASSE